MPDIGARVLVTGGNGFLGEALAARLLADGRPVRVTVRATAEAPAAGAVPVGDLADAPDWSDAVRNVDCIVHTAGRAHQPESADPEALAAFRRVNVDATLALAREAARAGVRRLVFISSAHVNGGVTHGRGFRADDAPAPVGAYAQSKLDAETGLAAIAAETGLEIVVIRPPLITGPGVKGNLASLYGALRRGLPLPFGLITGNRRDLVSRDTLCDLITVCLDHPAAAGRTFLVSDGAPLSTRALVERMADELGVRARLLPVPPALLRRLLAVVGRGRMATQLTGDLEIDIAATREALGWTPPTSRPGARP
ncbi:MAG: NAD-dependent epimerase/dehydratase family protein [Pseudomonadota bacterium]|nr:NAD-dependent epimerase/dehydratase family protein [Pseudomonadota bacterium]